MVTKLDQIIHAIEQMENITISAPFSEHEGSVKGTVSVTVETHTEEFEVLIMPPYPQQFHQSETIKFTGSDLLELGHVNFDGSICVHTRHATDLRQKLDFDFGGLKAWMLKYLINKDTDTHYEHIVVPYQIVGGRKEVMLFTEVEHQFSHRQYGRVDFSLLQHGRVKNTDTSTYLLQSFHTHRGLADCKWSPFYRSLEKLQGIYLYMDSPPVTNGRFAVESWAEMEGYLPEGFYGFLQATENRLSAMPYSGLSMMLGYPVDGGQVHWQKITIEKGRFPHYSQRLQGTRLYQWKLKDQPILWSETINSGYDYFFGRGSLSKAFTNKKILMVGIGAIGSIIATTLCRGGCVDFTLIDYEAKEPGNVCRSEYIFYSGISDKVDELVKSLISISPFVEARGDAKVADSFKLLMNSDEFKKEMRDHLDTYDLIFDCTADNDMTWLLDKIGTETDIINLSITNNAKELVCATGPNLYHNMKHIFAMFEEPDNSDLFNPTGCWSPTFRAGYNDIAVLVQQAIKQIDLWLGQGAKVRNFYLSVNQENGFNISMQQF